MRPRRPAAARVIAEATVAAHAAVLEQDAEALLAATRTLAGQNADAVAVVHGAVVRGLLERSFPDGVGGDDAEDVIARCRELAGTWFAPVDENLLLLGLTGALGMFAEEDLPGLAPSALHGHVALLVAVLLTRTGTELDELIDGAFAELERSQTMELP